MDTASSEARLIEADICAWMREFVAVKNEFYDAKFPPCPFALRALTLETVDVAVWCSGDVRTFIRAHAIDVRGSGSLTTRVMAFPPRVQAAWGLGDFVESLNAELIPDNVFLNMGVAKTTSSRDKGSFEKPYFIVVANNLKAVLEGAETLKRTGYYANWPPSHYEIVVERRERMAKRYGERPEVGNL